MLHFPDSCALFASSLGESVLFYFCETGSESGGSLALFSQSHGCALLQFLMNILPPVNECFKIVFFSLWLRENQMPV